MKDVPRLYSKNSKLKIGDLVTHALYGAEWIGVIIAFPEEVVDDLMKEKALVQVQPGTKYEGFFDQHSSKDKVNSNLGYVSIHWLFKMEIKNANLRPARNSTSRRPRDDKEIS